MKRWSVRPADVVLGTIPEGRRDDAERLISEDPGFREEVERLRRAGDAVAAVPAAAWSKQTPPPLDLPAALAARPARAAPTWRERLGDRVSGLGAPLVLRPGIALAAAVTLLVGGGVGGAALRGGEERAALAPASGPQIALRAFGQPGLRRAAVRLPAGRGGAVELRVAGAAPTRPGEHYELWLLDDAEHLVSVGTFRVGADGMARGRFPIGVDAEAFEYVDVSLEEDDGNPAHSRRSVLRSAPLD